MKFKEPLLFCTLHSNLVLFKCSNGYKPSRITCSLHSNLVLFKCRYRRQIYSIIILYIPIWFYSNLNLSCNKKAPLIFTFQSGSIQIRYSFSTSFASFSLYIPIWFYSNCMRSTARYKVINFTFQSGSIQMQKPTEHFILSLFFTFQSGSIQIYA